MEGLTAAITALSMARLDFEVTHEKDKVWVLYACKVSLNVSAMERLVKLNKDSHIRLIGVLHGDLTVRGEG